MKKIRTVKSTLDEQQREADIRSLAETKRKVIDGLMNIINIIEKYDEETTLGGLFIYYDCRTQNNMLTSIFPGGLKK